MASFAFAFATAVVALALAAVALLVIVAVGVFAALDARAVAAEVAVAIRIGTALRAAQQPARRGCGDDDERCQTKRNANHARVVLDGARDLNGAPGDLAHQLLTPVAHQLLTSC